MNQKREKLYIKIMGVYLCDLPAPDPRHKGEFNKKNDAENRPVLVISKHSNDGVATVLPMTTQPQNCKYSVKIASPLDKEKANKISWVVCNHPLTVTLTRLSNPKRGYTKILEEDFQRIMEKVHKKICGFYFTKEDTALLAEILGVRNLSTPSIQELICAIHSIKEHRKNADS